MASSSSANHDAVAKMQTETPLHEDNNSGGETFSIILTLNMASSSSANHDAVAKMQTETPLHEDNNSGGEK